MNAIRLTISKPIYVDQVVGESLESDPLYEFVEDQMMKIGSLSHTSVQWDKVEETLVLLLSEKTKDLKLLTYYFQCLHRKNTPFNLVISIYLIADFMTEFWESCYPYPGKKGNLPRRKYLSQIMQRFSLASEKLDYGTFSIVERNDFADAIKLLEGILKVRGLDSETVISVIELMKRKAKNAESKAPTKKQDQADKADQPRNAVEPSPSVTKINVDNSSDKATKQTLLNLAEFLAENESGFELAIRVRRHAVWSTITSLPDHSDNKTLITPLPQERIKEYWGFLGNADETLWKRVEKTLDIAPYWLDGQYLSSQIAKHLGKNTCAKAILAETKKFINRFPELHNFTFKNGEPFVSEACKNWLEEMEESSGSSSDSWGDRKKTAAELVEENGIGAALAMVNEGVSKASDPRGSCYWRLISTEIMQENQLNDLAQQQFQQLYSQIQSMSVTEWEPSLLKRLKKHITVK